MGEIKDFFAFFPLKKSRFFYRRDYLTIYPQNICAGILLFLPLSESPKPVRTEVSLIN